jgi:DNA polymerase-4
VDDVRRFSAKDLASALGAFGEWLWDMAEGRDDSPVLPEREALSVSNETTFEDDTDDPDRIRAVLLGLSERVGFRLRRMGARALGVEIKVRFEDFSTFTRSLTLPEPTDLSETVHRSALSLYRQFSADARRIRLLGMGVSRLRFQEGGQTELFESVQSIKKIAMHAAVDSLKNKYGPDIVSRASES